MTRKRTVKRAIQRKFTKMIRKAGRDAMVHCPECDKSYSNVIFRSCPGCYIKGKDNP